MTHNYPLLFFLHLQSTNRQLQHKLSWGFQQEIVPNTHGNWFEMSKAVEIPPFSVLLDWLDIADSA